MRSTCSKMNPPDPTGWGQFALWQYLFEFFCVCMHPSFPPSFPSRCATPVPLGLGGLYLCLCQLLCQLCRVMKQNSITERGEQTAAANTEMEEHHQRRTESTYSPSIIIYSLLAHSYCTAQNLYQLSQKQLKFEGLYNLYCDAVIHCKKCPEIMENVCFVDFLLVIAYFLINKTDTYDPLKHWGPGFLL